MKATDEDVTLHKVMGYIMDGSPRHQFTVLKDVEPYYHERALFSVVKCLITFGDRIVIPQVM